MIGICFALHPILYTVFTPLLGLLTDKLVIHNTYTEGARERETDRDRQTDRQTDSEREREREREREFKFDL